MEATMPNLRSVERRLLRDSQRASIYNAEIAKLEDAGHIKKITLNESESSEESWFLPHHLVFHNNKPRLVFNCSFRFQWTSLNEQLLPGPTLSPSLIGVLLRFRQHAVAISGDIKGMFHQVRLLPEDRPLVRFLWRQTERDVVPDIYEWQVLPFGTTSSPCCATFALQKHVRDNCEGGYKDVQQTVENNFYVDNCLTSLPSIPEAKSLVNKICEHLATGGFEMRQWASNHQSVVAHLPPGAR